MEKEYYCDFCQIKTNSFTTQKITVFTYKSKTLNIESFQRICSNCGNQVYDFELDNQTSMNAIREYNKQYGIIGQEIASFRRNLNLSQSSFAKILGLAKKTLVSYENSFAIPNDHYTQLLRAVMKNPKILPELAQFSASEFSAKEKMKISEIDTDDCIESINEYNGYTEPKKQKLIQSILFFMQKGIGMTKLNKALFYTDFSCYAKYAYSVTGNIYQRYNHGPFNQHLYSIVKTLETEKYIISDKLNPDIHDHYTYQTIIEPKLDIFEPDEIEILKRVYQYISSTSYTQVSEDSHLENAWTDTEQGQPISYEYALSLKQTF